MKFILLLPKTEFSSLMDVFDIVFEILSGLGLVREWPSVRLVMLYVWFNSRLFAQSEAF